MSNPEKTCTLVSRQTQPDSPVVVGGKGRFAGGSGIYSRMKGGRTSELEFLRWARASLTMLRTQR